MDPHSDKEEKTLTQADHSNTTNYANYFTQSESPIDVKLANFAKYVRRQDLTYFLTRYEIFKKVLNIHGSVIQCGVLDGSSLFSWAQLSSILEPINHNRKVIGFDTFEGFKGTCEKDGSKSTALATDGMSADTWDDLHMAIKLYDENRFLSHLNKIELVRGDLCETAERYVAENPHLVVSLLHLDCDIFNPTKAAIRAFVPRMPKGSIIVFDELNSEIWPGETLAVLEELGIKNLEIKRFSHDTLASYAVL